MAQSFAVRRKMRKHVMRASIAGSPFEPACPMSRWRPSAEKSTALITPEGHARLKAELDDLWRVRRPEVVRALAAAAAEGDRSENAEYTYRKKQLGEIDRRVRYLSKRLEALRVVDTAPTDANAVFFGAQVELEDADSGELLRYRIVGPDETDAGRGWISIDSPLARALLKKRVDDEFDAHLPAGKHTFVVVSVDNASL
ncbi:Transcription elongation factor GreB [Xanthomonas citri pv. bilvae]|nr:Transcription elongation factor GreB [Xanthomonas citri pv. bilvae]